MKPLKLNQFLDYHFLSHLKANPSHTQAAFVVKNANLKNNSYDSAIHLTDGKTTKVLTGHKKESSFIWLDDTHLLFGANRLSENKDDQMTTYYQIDIHGGEAQFAFTLPFMVSKIQKLDDERFIVVATSERKNPKFYTQSEEKRKDFLKTKKEQSFMTTLEELPFWSNGGTFREHPRDRLYQFNRSTNEILPLTPVAFDLQNLHIDHPHQKVYYSGETYQNKVKNQDELYVYDLETQVHQRLLKGQKYSYRSLYVIKDTLLVEASDHQQLGMNQNSKFYEYDSQQDQLILQSDELLIGNSIGSDVRLGMSPKTLIYNQELYFNATVDDHSELYKMNENYEIERVYTSMGSIDGFTIVNGQLLTIELLDQPQELFEIINQKAQALTTFNSDLLKDSYLAPIRTFSFSSHDDVLTGYVLEPFGYEETKTYPAIMNIHGGPKTAYGPVYYHEMQFWASQGYFVFFTNPHGSSGRSDRFSDIRGRYGTLEYEDLMTLVDEVLVRYPQIDAQRLGVTGGSYGGFMTNWIITHTDRFKAAATQRSISNWLSFGISDIGYYFAPDQNAADYYSEEGQLKLWHHSPLKYVKNVKTPTLIIHSDKDYRCPIDQGYQLFNALMDLQVKTKMVIFHDEDHDLSRSGKPQARIKRLEEITQWMDKYLKP